MLQWLYTYVVNLCSQCSIYFLDVCCKCVYLDVAYASHIYCKYFIWMLHMFAMVFKCFFSVFAIVSHSCLKCFICLQTYVTIVVSKCFKSRSGVAYVVM
jgi:hypothetical protein